MSEVMEEESKRWTARRKSALVLEIIQGKTTVAAASRQFDLTPAEIESWVLDGKPGMENALRAKPEDVREQYERQLKDLQEAVRRGHAGDPRPKNAGIPAGEGRELMLSVQQGLKDEGFAVPMTKLCQWFGVARRTTYCKPTRSPPKVKPELAEPIKEMIEAEPSFGYRTVAGLLGMNKNTVQRIFQLKGWQVRKRALGQRPRIEAKVFTSRYYTRLVRSYGLKQEFITPHCPQQNGMVERVIRTLKEQCVHRQRFESQTHALRVIADRIAFYNQQRPHRALKIITPDVVYAATSVA